MRFPRSGGVLVHPTSFPSPYGIGDLGKGAYEFVDFLVKAKQSIWQILPLGPTGYGDSPYQSFSAFAGNPLLISPELLVRDGFMPADLLADIPDFPTKKVDFGWVIQEKQRLLNLAFHQTLCSDDRPLLFSISKLLGRQSIKMRSSSFAKKMPIG